MESEREKHLESIIHALRIIIIHARAARSKATTDAILDLAISRMPGEYKNKIRE